MNESIKSIYIVMLKDSIKKESLLAPIKYQNEGIVAFSKWVCWFFK